MADILSIKDYYNRYDQQKEYGRLLFIAGKVIQSSELNEVQSTILDRIKNVSDTLLTNGDIIEGCQLVIGESSVTITPGKVYLEGNVRNVPSTTLNMTFKGEERIGVKLVTSVATPADDKDLLDPATGHPNYGSDGAYRLKETVEITVNDETANTLYTLVDGIQEKVTVVEDMAQLDKINNMLAKRTRDESGNYKVEGLDIVDHASHDENNLYVSIEPGRAYVRGYEVAKDTAVNIPIERPNSLRLAINEPKVYHTGVESYLLNNSYVNRVSSVTATVAAEADVSRRSIAGGTDYLNKYPVVNITEVTQGDITYVQGTDYELSAEGVSWALSGNEPNPGETYHVKWTYNKDMVRNTDYELLMDENGDRGRIHFMDGGDKPVDGSSFLVDYDYKLCRIDVLGLDSNGKIVRTAGQPDILRTVSTPNVSDDEVLVLGSVMTIPNSDTISIINNDTKTISMLDLHRALERLNQMEYNQAMTDLDQEAAAGEPATQLKGVFTDGFIGLSKSDVYHREWSASLDLDNALLTVPYTPTVTGLTVNQDANPVAGQFSRLLTAPYSTQKVLSQSLATGIMRVNAYNAFPKNPVPKLTPASDNWIDEKTVTVQGETQVKSVTIRRWWYHLNESWAQEEKALMMSYGFADGGVSLGWGTGSATTQKTVVTSILDNALMYMRQRRVDVSVSCLEPNVDNIEATFDGRVIPLTPVGMQYQGTAEGTLKADLNGNTYGYFTIPENTRCGTRELRVYARSTPSLVGSAKYSAEGRQRVTTKTVFTEKVVVNPTDPIAQSFQFTSDMYITSVGLYFKDKDGREPITVQLRNMVNGYPGTTVYAEKVMNGSDIHTGTVANQETVVRFDDPVYLHGGTQYCITVLSDSDIDSLWIAETSQRDVTTSASVAKNPYLAGMLFSSSNALTWTAHQNADLKFNLYGIRFVSDGEIIFNDVEGLDASSILLMSEEAIPAGCAVEWQFAQDGTNEWLPLSPCSERTLTKAASSIRLKAVLKANGYTSPAIALDSLILVSMKNSTQGVYVSKNVELPEGFNHVKVIADLEMPAGTSITVSFANDVDGAAENWIGLTSTSTEQLSQSVTTYTFERDLSSKQTQYRVKLQLETNNPLVVPKVRNLRSILKIV